MAKTSASRVFNPTTENTYDRVIVGGGLAALFTAYETLKEARAAGKSLSLAVIADQISAPAAAGSHAVYGLDGMFIADVPGMDTLNGMMRKAMSALEQTVTREKIDCGFLMGYEIKGKDAKQLGTMAGAVLEKKIYGADEVTDNSATQIFHLPGHSHSVKLDCIGQVNIPDLLAGLVNSIRNMGGQVLTGTRYESHEKNATGGYTLQTSKGLVQSRNQPLLATGAHHQMALPDFPVNAQIVHTMGMVFGPIESADLKKYFGTSGPIAFCDSNLEGDMLWGGIDDKGRLTVGRGDLTDPAGRDKLQNDILAQMEEYFPGLTTKYPPNISFGPMLVPENMMPVIGRLQNYDIMGGWVGRGIVPGYMAAQAYAQYAVHGDDKNLRLLENMQPGAFQKPQVSTEAVSKVAFKA